MYSVKNLEEQLGFELFDRTQYRPIITHKGESFLMKSQKILDDMQELHEEIKLIASDVEMRLRISSSGIFNSSHLYPVLKKAMKKFSSTEIIFEKEILSGEKMLAREMVDLAIFENLKNKRDYDYKKISEVHLKLVIAKGHDFFDLPKKDQVKSKLYNYPQIIQRSTIKDDDFHVGVHKESLKWKVTDTPSKREIIINGLGWGRLPYHIIEKDLKQERLIHLSKFKDDDTVDIFLCKHKNKHMGKVAQFIWDSF
jgi:DNA-binding transcriptional LysR family regulator